MRHHASQQVVSCAIISENKGVANYMKTKDDIKRISNYFKGRDEVCALYVFGSAASGRQTQESDIDIAVLIDESKSKKRDYAVLRNKYYADSPYFSLRPLDIVVLNTASPYLKHRIIKTGKVIFDRNRKLRVRFTTNAIIEYLDYKPIEDIFTKAVANRFRGLSVGR